MNNITKYPFSEFKYWFTPDSTTIYNIYYGSYHIGQLGDNDFKDSYALNIYEDYKADHSEDEINADFAKYKQTRPEYTVGKLSSIVNSGAQDNVIQLMIDDYQDRLLGAYLIRKFQESFSDIDKYIPIFEDQCISWLENSDMYTAPSSTRYHDACDGGLLYHSLKVYNLMIEFMRTSTFESVDVVSATITSLTHDWCKIGLYEAYQKNVKNEVTGQWEQEKHFRHKVHNVPLGHGVTSLYIASRVFPLTLEESLAIRWHMGPWAIAKGEDAEMAQACDAYPLVLLIQFADQLSTRDYPTWGLSYLI